MRFKPAFAGALGGILLCLLFPLSSFAQSASPTCTASANPIVNENCLPGTDPGVWDINGAGDPTIQGFATDISVNVGETINFKIKTPATSYVIDIYRLGYYGGMGARKITTIQPSATLPQVQPDCLTDTATHLVDCGNWAISASWPVPASAVSGVYLAHLIRTDTPTQGDSHIIFVVRNDNSSSDILFQTSDTTWQAYNSYGDNSNGYSLYGPALTFDANNRAYRVSYNRPFNTRAFGAESTTWFFGAEVAMVRWLERNGYNVSYFTGVDASRSGSQITNHHKIYMSVGHDEYWSGDQRHNVEMARDAGVNLAFFSGNEVYWKTAFGPSIDASATPNRTLICYKETFAGQPLGPLDPPIWTGTWRDGRWSPPADGGRPENALTGTLFIANGPGPDNDGTLSIQVPSGDGKMRFWRNTNVAKNAAAGTTTTLAAQTLGYEWDGDPDNGSRPSGTFPVSTATYTLTNDLILDEGATFGAGTATHHMTMHRAPSGALVFGAGTIQYSWGLDSHHDDNFGTPQAEDPNLQQATVNLLADMGVQPATLQTGSAATASTDAQAPSSKITWPTNGTSLASGSSITISGTATDTGGGVVGGVELSLDGGNTWHPANGRENWTYAWTPNRLGAFTLKSRAADDSANIELPGSGISVVTVNPSDCPCNGLSSSNTPSLVDSGDGSSVEVGVKFRADFAGLITGIRFYKAAANTGTHIGNLWRRDGTLLATAIFTNETSSGWQQVDFSNPIAITADTTYVASYFAPNGHYSATGAAFNNSNIDNPPIHFLASGVDGSNGIFTYSSTNVFPTSSFNDTNYWVDVVYVPASSMPGAPPALLLNPSKLSFVASSQGVNPPPSQPVTVYNEGTGTLNWTASSNASWLLVSPTSGSASSSPQSLTVSVDASKLAAGTYTGTITVSAPGASNPPQTISVTLSVTNVLLFSNFADGTMDGWAFSPLGLNANWSVSNGSLNYNGGGHTQVYAGDSSWTDYKLSAAIKVSALKNYPGGIRGRIDPVTGAGYVAWLYPAEGLVRLFHITGWNIDSSAVTVTLLGVGSVLVDTTNFHNLQLSFQGSQIQVSYDGIVIITVTDSTSSSGLIALDVHDQPVSFTNVMVTSLNANNDALALGTNSLTFNANLNSNPSPQSVSLSSSGGTLAWTARSDQTWLTVSPGYGNSPAALQVSIASSALNAGSYSGNIKIVSLGVTNTTQIIPVSLTVGGGALTTQTVTVTSNVPSSQVYNTSFNLSAAGGGSGNPVTFALDAGSGACSIGSVANAGGTFTAAVTMTSGTGNCIIDLNQAGNANYTAAQQVQVSVPAAKANQATLTVTGPAAVAYGASATASASGGNGTGALTFSAGSSSGCSVSGTTVVVSNATGSCSLLATQAADSNYNQATSAAFTVALNKATPTVKIFSGTTDVTGQTASFIYSGVPQSLTAAVVGVGSDSLSASMSYDGSSTAPTNVKIVNNAAAAYNVVASYGASNNYNAASATASEIINKTNALISVTPYSVTYDGQAHTAGGSATGVESTPANLSSLLTLTSTTHTNAGTYNNDSWSFAGNNNYNAASGTINDTIGQANSLTTVSFPAGPYVYNGNAFKATAQVAGVDNLGTSVSITYSGDCINVTTTNGCTATAAYAGDANHTGSTDTKSISITKANAVITVIPYAVSYDGQAHTASGSATGVESTPADLSSLLTLTGTTHTNAGTYSGDLWSFAGNNNYNATSGTVSDSIAQATSSVTVTFQAGPYVYSGAAFTATAQVSGTSTSVPVSYSGNCINVTTANGCTATATYAGDTNRAGSTGTSSITITKANSMVSVNCSAGAPYVYTGSAQTPCIATATGVGNLSVALTPTYSNNVGAGTASATATYAGDANHTGSTGSGTFVIGAATSTITWATPANIAYGTALSSTQLNATSSVPGTFSYTPVAGTVLAPGSGQKLSVAFTPNDSVDNSSATASVLINVIDNPPLAGSDSYSTNENTPLTVSAASGVLANDSDTAGNAMTATLVSAPTNGTVTLNADGSFSYTPNNNFYGTDTFAYKASDGFLSSNVATVTVTINFASASATLASGGGTVTTDANNVGTSAAVPVQTSVTSPIAGTVSIGETATTQAAAQGYSFFGQQINITAPVSTASNPLTLIFTVDASLITPGQNQNTTQIFRNGTLVPNCTSTSPSINPDPCVSSRVQLPNGGVRLTVLTSHASAWNLGKSLSNSPPTAANDTYTTDAGTTLTVAAPGVLANDTDPDLNTLSVANASAPAHGTLTINPNGSFTYVPAAGYSGLDQFTYYANDGQVNSVSPATVSIKVRALTTTSALTSSLNPSTYGQSVTFTAMVTSAAGAPSGTVQFYDGSTLLGSAPVTNGTGSYTTTAVNAGTRSITAAFTDSSNTYASSTSPIFTQTVNKASTTSGLTASVAQQQYSDLETFTATLTPSSGQLPSTAGVIFSIGTQTLNANPIPFTVVNGVPTATLSNYALLETVSGALKPGIRGVTATFQGVGSNFTVGNVSKSISITKEDARTYYAGPASVSTGSSTVSTATIPLQWTIKDITAVPSDPAWDPNPGDITLAQVIFVNRSTGVTIATAPVSLVANPSNPNDKTIGTASYNWSVDIGTASSQSFTVGVIVTGYYNRNSTTENAVITVSKP